MPQVAELVADATSAVADAARTPGMAEARASEMSQQDTCSHAAPALSDVRWWAREGVGAGEGKARTTACDNSHSSCAINQSGGDGLDRATATPPPRLDPLAGPPHRPLPHAKCTALASIPSAASAPLPLLTWSLHTRSRLVRAELCARVRVRARALLTLSQHVRHGPHI
jgi:hypothetical protein